MEQKNSKKITWFPEKRMGKLKKEEKKGGEIIIIEGRKMIPTKGNMIWKKRNGDAHAD